MAGATAADSTRRRILEAAAIVLSERGLAESHLSTIAHLAELKAPAVYHYFASRDELVVAVMSEGQRMVRDRVVAALARLPADAPVAERVDAAVEAHLLVELDESVFARAVVRNAGQLAPALRVAFESDSRAFHDVWRSLVDRAQSEGRLRPGLGSDAARLLAVGALNGCAEWWRPDVPVATVVRTAQQLVRAALLTSTGRSGRL